jgi:hypothetical protein
VGSGSFFTVARYVYDRQTVSRDRCAAIRQPNRCDGCRISCISQIDQWFVAMPQIDKRLRIEIDLMKPTGFAPDAYAEANLLHRSWRRQVSHSTGP